MILFQTSDEKLRKKILVENLNYDHMVQWGNTHKRSGKQAKQVEQTGSRADQEVREEG